MPANEYRASTPGSASGSQFPLERSFPSSRTQEFTSGINGGGSTVHTVQQMAPQHYFPSSVLNPIPGSTNGENPETYQQNRILDYYRS